VGIRLRVHDVSGGRIDKQIETCFECGFYILCCHMEGQLDCVVSESSIDTRTAFEIALVSTSVS